jgi:hypothetical protein
MLQVAQTLVQYLSSCCSKFFKPIIHYWSHAWTSNCDHGCIPSGCIGRWWARVSAYPAPEVVCIVMFARGARRLHISIKVLIVARREDLTLMCGLSFTWTWLKICGLLTASCLSATYKLYRFAPKTKIKHSVALVLSCLPFPFSFIYNTKFLQADCFPCYLL